jgi:curved DNA-binding protein CbpA
LLAHIDQLVTDLDAYAAGETVPFSKWQPRDDYVGAALIALASSKVPRRIAEQLGDTVSTARRDAARRFIASYFFAFDADYYAILGSRRTASNDSLQKNYRRLMTLVHPDSSPVGFPLDAAARANKAYAALSETSTRDEYDRNLSVDSSVVATIAPSVEPVARNQRRNEHRSRLSRIRQWLPTLGFRKGLIAIGAGMLIVCAFGFYQLMSSEPQVVLVEAKPRQKQPPELGLSAPIAEAKAASAEPAASTGYARSVASPNLQQTASTNASANLSTPLRLTTELRKSAAGKTDAPERAATIEPSPSVNPPSQIAVSTRRNPEPVATIEARSDNASQTTEAPSPSALPPPRDERSAADVDALLAQFANAFEAGSLSAMKQSFSANMSGRNAVLADYERVFQTTKQRNIYFSRMRQNSLSTERLVTSGIATVATVDHENRSTRQRVFLEIEILREPTGARISRIANYEQP